MGKLRSIFSLMVLGVAMLLARASQGSLVLALDTTELAKRADHIAVADVISVESAWDQAHRKIYTTIDLSVVESWKGGTQPAEHIKVVQPGGTVGDISMTVFGMSRFTPGERTLVFLRGKTTAAGVVGMAQGKRSMLRDAVSGKWTVGVASSAGLERVPIPATKPLSAIGTAAPRAVIEGPRSLDEVRGQVQQILKAQP
jgi:hypothetical protein